jgi:hypothetical protein
MEWTRDTDDTQQSKRKQCAVLWLAISCHKSSVLRSRSRSTRYLLVF